jgi:hypothetical protein
MGKGRRVRRISLCRGSLMKYRLLFLLWAFSILPSYSAPGENHGPGPIFTCFGKAPNNTKSIFDAAPEITELAQKSKKQLFDSSNGSKILRRSKELGEYYSVNLHVDENGNIDRKNVDEHTFHRALSGPKKQLEKDIDRLIVARWNKPNILKKPIENGRFFQLKITPDGILHVDPFYGPGPVQYAMVFPKMMPNEFLESTFDHDPKAVALAEKYQHQLFDDVEARDILRRSKENSEHFVRLVDVTTSRVEGVSDPKARILQSAQAKSGPKQKLEADINSLLDARLNKLSTADIPPKYIRSFEIEITPMGEAHVRPHKLYLNVLEMMNDEQKHKLIDRRNSAIQCR